MSRETILLALHEAMDAAEDIPSDEIDTIEGLIQAGEQLVAFEVLVTQVVEYDIVLEPNVRQGLLKAGAELGAEASYLEDLRPSA